MRDLKSSLLDMLCDPTDIIWWKGTPYEAMTGHTAPSSDGLQTEIFLSSKANATGSVRSPGII